MKKIQLTLEIAEVNQILSALGKQPYGEVFTLIASIQQQAAPQLQTPHDTPAEMAGLTTAEKSAIKGNDQ